jgi:hypothetical protein
MPLIPIHPPKNPPHRIEIELSDMNQLFNTMDPSPFLEKDLDADAEEFIVNWAREIPVSEPLVLTIHVSRPDPVQRPDAMIEKAVQNYFRYRGQITRLDLRRLLREGRLSLLIGSTFLACCLTIAGLLSGNGERTIRAIAQEGLTIAGWVALWRPLEIYLYDWWPVLRRCRVFEKLAKMPVEIHRQPEKTAATQREPVAAKLNG